MNNFDFQFTFLPSLLRENNDIDALKDISNLKMELVLNNKSYNMDDLKIIHTIRQGVEDFLLEFKTAKVGEAIYILVVAYRDMLPLYFSLERGRGENCLFCRVDISDSCHFLIETSVPSSIGADAYRNKVYSHIEAHQDLLIDRYDGDEDDLFGN